ncbi:MAG TPA: pyridoxamine 5'-phosphate oxidase family protein [Polyangiaceae bacterium]|nr:pyridoxamine 5'-phosphate oxidase family protein [Polyangiaceae bacterium]
MGKVQETIDLGMRELILAQKMFFVASAPSGPGGHVNLSPKGLDTFRILDDRTVAYLDFVGSGVETIAHLRENGRVVLMFCAFEGPPKIVRLHGRGEALEPGTAEFERLRPTFPDAVGVRSIIVVHVARASDSCGFAVPLYEYKGDRQVLGAWAEKKGEEGLADYQRKKNAESIDGLPGLRWTSDAE